MSFNEEYAKYYNLFYESKGYKKEVDFLEEIFKKYSNVKNVLDLGCGTGIHSKYLASRGYMVSGIDISKEMINIAKLKATPNTEFFVGNMTCFSLDKKFDACITMAAAIGYLTENKQIEDYLNSVKKHLKKNGLLILDCWNGLGVMHDLPKGRIKEVELENLKIKRTSYPDLDAFNHKCNVKFDVDIFEKGNLIKNYEENHSVRFFFPQELRKYLEDTGFEVLEICKVFELGTKPNETDWHMSVIARLKK